MTIVPRVVDFSTVFNFRDLGGYPTVDGRAVRWGQLYRSDGLWRLADNDIESFAALGIRTVLDLRRPDELAADGRVVDSLGLAYHNINFHADMWPEEDLTADDMPRYLADRYAEMAEGGLTGANAVGSALRLLVRDDAAPLVFHCAAGKDRTGVLAALTLSVLGVDDDHIADDYALSADAERRYHASRRALAGGQADEEAGHAPPWVLNPCPHEAMLIFLTELRDRHGSVEAFLNRAGITDADTAALRERLLD
jgi:protein tyrosine/serine phosphatase